MDDGSRIRVAAARAAAAARWAGSGRLTNATVTTEVLLREHALPREATDQLRAALRAGAITTRGAERVLRLAWTLADLAGHDRPDRALVGDALSLRAIG